MEVRHNYGYMVGYIFTTCIANVIIGYSFTFFGTVSQFMYLKYDSHDQRFFNFFVSSIVVIGAIASPPIGAHLAMLGRRKAMMIITLILIIA